MIDFGKIWTKDSTEMGSDKLAGNAPKLPTQSQKFAISMKKGFIVRPWYVLNTRDIFFFYI